MKTPDYMNYSRYKKNKKKDNKKSTYMFIATFCVLLFIFVGMAKVLSPDVDINLGNESDYEAKDTGLGVKKFIDNRLKMIQNDDNGESSTTSATSGGFGDGYSNNGTVNSNSSNSSAKNRKTRDYNDASFDNYSTSEADSDLKASKKRHSSSSDDITDDNFGLSSSNNGSSARRRTAPQRTVAR